MSRTWQIILGIILAGAVAMSFVGPSKESTYIWDTKTFFAVYGFVGCVVIIYASKAAGKYWLQRNPDYYEPYRAPAEVGDAAASDEGPADA